MLRNRILPIIAVFVLLLSNAAFAATTWTGSVSTLWSVSGNWSSGVPNSTIDVVIPTTTRLPTVDVASACKSISITGSTTLTLSAALTVSGGLTVNGGTTFATAGTNTATFAGLSSVGNPGTLNIGSGSTLTFNAGLSINAGGTLVNSGKLNSTSSVGITTGNPGVITNNSTGTITLTGSLLNIGGGTNITNSGQIIVNAASTFTTGNPVSLSNTSTGVITFDASTANFNGGTTISNAGDINGNNSSTINTGNPVPITNTSTSSIDLSASIWNLSGGSHIDNSGRVSAISGSKISFANPSYINNLTSTSTLVVTASTLDISAGGYITNSGTVTSTASSTIKLNGNPVPITNNVNATFNATSTAFTMVAGTTITNTGGTFNLTNCTLAASGNPTTITNQNSGATVGNFTMDNTAFTFSGTNAIVNSGTFTAKNGSSINITSGSASSSITNSGTFYGGVSNSACVITLDGNQPKLTNNSSAIFYLGSTSILYPTSSNCLVANSGTFTLQSDAYGSAAIGAIPTNANPNPSITGTYNVERFYQGGSVYDNVKQRYKERGYRIISSAVNTGTQVNSNNIYGLNYIVGSTAGQTTAANSSTNAFITGATGGNTSAGNPTLYLYRENKIPSNSSFTSGNFIGITNITSASSLGTIDAGSWTIPVGNGVLFFFRGAATNWSTRTVSPYIAPESVTLTQTGNLNQGSITVKDWYTPTSSNLGCTSVGGSTVKGFNMLGNPYASTIDIDKINTGGITATNIDPTIYVLNPVTNQYETFSTSTHTGSSTFDGKIVSGQGFFVKALTSSATFTFNESCKTPATQKTGTALFMGAPVNQEVSKLLRLKMSADSTNYDDVVIGFKASATPKFNGYEDAKDLGGMGAIEGLTSFSTDDQPVALAINFLPLPKQAQTIIRLGVTAAVSRQFTLQRVALDTLPKIYEVWLMDKYMKDSLDLRANKSYIFNVDLSDTASYGNNRFSIVIRQNKALDVHLLNFTATKATNGALVAWKTENEDSYTNFTVQRSTDNGVTYDVLGGFASNGQNIYNFTDKNPAKAVDLYRLKIEDLNGAISYSKAIPLTYGDAIAASNNISVYPNPAVGTINLAIKPDTRANLLSGVQSINKIQGLQQQATGQTYAIKIVSINGNVVKSATSSQPSWQDDVGILTPGTYIIQVINNSDKSLVGKTTFVKI